MSMSCLVRTIRPAFELGTSRAILMPAEYTPVGRELGPIFETFMVRPVGQVARLQRTESRYGAPDRANWGRPRNPAILGARMLFITVQVAACLLSSCAGRPADRPVTPPPDVLLVTIDTLRADRVGVYGGLPATTPNLDSLARRGVTFMR